MVADPYDDHRTLQRAFVQALGYHHRGDLPEDLIAALAAFCDTHADAMMMPYYAASLVNQFWRKRNVLRRDRFVQLMHAQMARKSALLEVLRTLRSRHGRCFGDDCLALMPMWEAIRELPDGYRKANYINLYAQFFQQSELNAVLACAQAMVGGYRARAFTGLYPRLDAGAQAQILAYLFEELDKACWEGRAQLKLLFPSLDPNARTRAVQRMLAASGVGEFGLAYFAVRNAQFIDAQDARALAVRLHACKSEYLKIRGLLKLAPHLPAPEIEALCEGFLATFEARPASEELIHNLYHVSAFTSLGRADIVSMALRKIAQLDDSANELWNQQKYTMLSFLAPHLEREHQDAALAIAHQVGGGYRKGLLARLRRNLAVPGHAFAFRPASIIY